MGLQADGTAEACKAVDAREREQLRFEGLVKRFLDYLRGVRRVSPNTQRAYASDLQQYCDWVRREGICPMGVSHRELRSYLAELSAAGYSPKTINRHLSALRTLYAWLVSEGETNEDSAAAISGRKVARTLPRTLTDEQVQALLDTCDTSAADGLRDRAFLELLYATGARISEVAALNVGDVQGGRLAQVRLFGKGSKERIVPLYRGCVEWVERYERNARPQLFFAGERGGLSKEAQADAASALFISTRGRRMSAAALRLRFEAHAREAGLDSGVTPHAMRHTFATELLSGGADLRSVQELLGHESLQTTQIYTHLSVERLKEATRQAHPRG